MKQLQVQKQQIVVLINILLDIQLHIWHTITSTVVVKSNVWPRKILTSLAFIQILIKYFLKDFGCILLLRVVVQAHDKGDAIQI